MHFLSQQCILCATVDTGDPRPQPREQHETGRRDRVPAAPCEGIAGNAMFAICNPQPVLYSYKHSGPEIKSQNSYHSR